MTKPARIEGGFQDFRWSASMAPIRLRREHMEAIHEDDMAEDWYAKVADECYAKARDEIARVLKVQLMAMAYGSPLREKVVDRRPSRIALVRNE